MIDRATDPLTPLPLDREEAAALLRSDSREFPPRRFAVYELYDAGAPFGYDGAILGWGLDLGEQVILHRLDGGPHGRFRTAETMLRLLTRRRDVELVWLDEPAEQTPEGA